MSAKVLFLVMLGVATSMAAITGDNLIKEPVDETSPDAPKRCCTPKQWEGILSGLVGYQERRFKDPNVLMEVLGISYDAKNQRVAMNGTIYNHDRASNIRVIELFKEKKMYVIDEEGKCVSQDLPGAFQEACVPATAKYNGRFKQGYGTESITEDSWTMKAMGYDVFFSVTPKQCIPTSETVFGRGEGRRGVPVLSVLGYVNITPGIKSKTAFTPPKDCPSGFSALGNGILQYMHGKIGGF